MGKDTQINNPGAEAQEEGRRKEVEQEPYISPDAVGPVMGTKKPIERYTVEDNYGNTIRLGPGWKILDAAVRRTEKEPFGTKIMLGTAGDLKHEPETIPDANEGWRKYLPDMARMKPKYVLPIVAKELQVMRDRSVEILEWYNSLMPKLMETPIGRSFVTAKLRERLLNNGNEAKVVYTGSGGNPLIWPKKLRFSHEVEYSYMVGSNGLGLCIDGEIVYVPYYRWGNFEVVRL